MAKSTVCLKDIAKDLNLSINTVSRSLRNCSDISNDTKNKVTKKASEMGYIASRFKGFYELAKEKTIILVFDSLSNPYFVKMSEELVKKLDKKGYQSLIFPVDSNKMSINIIKRCMLKRCCLCVSFLEIENDAIQYANKNNFPIILLGRNQKCSTIDMIYSRDFEGGEIAGKALYRKDCDKYLYFSEDSASCSNERYLGFAGYLKKMDPNISVEKVDVLDYKKGIVFLEKGYKKLFFFNDPFAYMFIQKCKIERIDLSGVSVVGYDGTLSKYMFENIPFLSISPNKNTVAEKVFEIINAKLEMKTKKVPCLSVELPVRIV